jgi:tRNA-dihydrouridine synthase
VKKVVDKGAGACLLQDVDKMVRLTAAVVKAVKLPVTVKTRLVGTMRPRTSWRSRNACRTWASRPEHPWPHTRPALQGSGGLDP